MKNKLKHYTSSIFIFHKFETGWKLLFVHHKKFDRWMIPGGHVESNENPIEAVKREAYEETSIRPKLISFLHRKFEETDSTWLLPPEYFFEQRIPERKGEEEHFHLDCAYVSLSQDDGIKHQERESNGIKWFSEDEIREETSMFVSTQKIALIFFQKLKQGKLEDIVTYIEN